MSQKNDENQLNLAIQALKNDPKLKVYTASKIYKVDHRKLGERLRGAVWLIVWPTPVLYCQDLRKRRIVLRDLV